MASQVLAALAAQVQRRLLLVHLRHIPGVVVVRGIRQVASLRAQVALAVAAQEMQHLGALEQPEPQTLVAVVVGALAVVVMVAQAVLALSFSAFQLQVTAALQPARPL
jgi:hypothetical protein